MYIYNPILLSESSLIALSSTVLFRNDRGPSDDYETVL